MMRLALRSKLTVAVGALAVMAAGCSGCGGPDECDDVLVSYTTLSDGATVNAVTDVTIKVENKTGGPVEVETAKLKTRPTSATEFSAPRDGTITGSNATFPAVPLEVGPNILRATVTQKGRTCEGTKTITVVVSDVTAAPSVTAFTFQGDANNDKTLNSMELTGTQVVAQLAVSDGEGGTVSVKNVSGGSAEVGAGTVANGMATVTLTLPVGSDASFILFAEVTANGKKNDATANPAAQVTLVIDRTGPAVTLMSPSKLIQGPGDDADLMNMPFQLRTLAVGTGDVSTIEIAITDGTNQQTTGAVPPSNGTVSRDFDVPAAGTVQYTVTATARDLAGNVATDSKMVTVDYDAPTIDIVSPTAAGGPYSMASLPISVTVTGADGQLASVFTTLNGSTRLLGQFLVMNGTAMAMANFLPGTQVVSATVTDAAGNISTPDNETIVITAPMTGCPLIFSLPANDPQVLTRLDDLNPGLADLQYQFEVTSTAACANKSVTLFRQGNMTLVASGLTNSSGVLRFAQLSLPDSAGQAVTYEAEISDGMGNLTREPQTVVISLQRPAIILPANNSTVNVSQDLDLTAPGVQRSLQYAPAAPSGATTTICSDVALAGFTSGVCPDGVGFALASMVAQSTQSFTFPPGSYKLKPVFVLGVSNDTGDYSTLIVDDTRPKVLSVAFMGDANADKKLNATELPMGVPQAIVSLMGLEDGRPVTVRNSVNSAVVGTGTSAGGAATITLNGLGVGATTEADFSLEVEITDAANNSNKLSNPTAADPLNTAAFVSLRVDKVAPVTTITTPNKTQLGIADDANMSAGYQLAISALVPSDVGANGVHVVLSGGASQMADVTPASGTANHNFNVSNMGTTAYVLTLTSTDGAGNVGPAATLNVTVDNEAPVVTLVAPSASGSPYGTFSITTTVNVVGGTGLNADIYSKVGAAAEAQLASLPINMAGVASNSVTFPDGLQVVRAEVVDAAGNKGESSQTITVVGAGCSVLLTNPSMDPATLNKSNDTIPGTATLADFALTGVSSNCPNQAVSLFSGPVGSQMLVGNTTTNGSGNFTFNLSLMEGAYRLEAQITVGPTTTSDKVDLTIDLSDPMVSNVSPTGANLFFVNPSNANLVPPAASNYVADTNTGLADAQFSVSVTVANAVGGNVTVIYGGNTVAGPQALAMTPQTLTMPVSLAHNSTGSFEIRVRDAAGNQVSQVSNATVDVLAPGFPVAMAAIVAGKERTTEVSLNWMPTYDDGITVGSGDNAGYDVRWTTAVVVPGGLTGPTANDDFFSGTKTFAESTSAWSDGGISRTIAVPPLLSSPSLTTQNLNQYYFYVRAKDEVGNYSVMAAGTQVNSALAAFALANPRAMGTGNDEFGLSMFAKGSLNNDNIDDLVVGSGALAVNLVYVYYGAADAGIAGATPQVITGGAGERFGGEVSVGDVGNDMTGAKNDLLATSRQVNKAVLYFGSASAATIDTAATNTVIFAGPAGSEFGRAGQIIPDMTGDGLDEILFGAPNDNTFRGRAYLFYGRGISAWKALPNPITMASADRIFEGPSGTVNRFGRNRGGITAVGLTDAGSPDFTIPNSWQAAGKLFIFSSATVADAGTGATFTTGTDVMNPDQSRQTMVTPTSESGTNAFAFGTRAIGQHNFLGTSAVDLVVGHGTLGRVYIYGDRTGAGFPATPTFTLNPRSTCNTAVPLNQCLFGQDIQAVDFTGDGRPDLAVGEFSPDSSAWLFVNRPMSGMEFDPTAGTGFWQSRIPAVGAGRLGVGVVTGDFNSDGKPDLVIADDKDGIGKVLVWQ